MCIQRVRRATPTMVGAINALLPQLDETAPPMTLERLKIMLAQRNFVLLAAREKNAVRGVASIYYADIPTKRTAWIEDVVVDAAARGRGVGRVLTKELIRVAQKWGAHDINLTSRPERAPANALYQKLGFEKRITNVYRYYPERS